MQRLEKVDLTHPQLRDKVLSDNYLMWYTIPKQQPLETKIEVKPKDIKKVIAKKE